MPFFEFEEMELIELGVEMTSISNYFPFFSCQIGRLMSENLDFFKLVIFQNQNRKKMSKKIDFFQVHISNFYI